MREDYVVRSAADLRDLFAENCIHLIRVPVCDDVLIRLRADAFAVTTPTDRLLITSASEGDFSWELANRLIVTEPAADDLDATGGAGVPRGSAESTMWLIPSLLDDPGRLQNAHPGRAVILARRNATPVADVDAAAQLLAKAGFIIRGVVIVDGDHRRWRRWRRFTLAYGVGADPERPWPAIDVLEEEKRRNTAPTRRWRLRG